MTSTTKIMDPLIGQGWIAILRGLWAIIAGIACFILPAQLVATALVILFAFYVIADGLFNILNAISTRSHERWWTMLLLGGIEILIGLLTFALAKNANWVLFLLIAVWAIVMGASMLLGALQLRQIIPGDLWLVIAGGAAIIFGIIVLIMSLIGLNILRYVLGVYLLAQGVALIAFGIRLMGLRKTLE